MKPIFKVALSIFALFIFHYSVFAQTSISSFSPTSGPVGTLITINGSNLSDPDFVSIGVGDAIVLNSSPTRIQAIVMPECRTGVLSLRAGGRTVDAQNVFTVTSNNLPNAQDGNKLVGGNSVFARQGAAVAISADGNTAIVGGFGDDMNKGAAWIFTRSGGIWSQQGQKLVGSGWVAVPNQGYSVAISADGNTVAIGGNTDNGNNQGKTGRGAVWVFTRVNNFWAQQGSKLTASDGDQNSQLGKSVALSADGNTLLVGGNFDRTDPFNGKANGAAWVFTRFFGQWRQFGSKMVPTDNTGYAQFGTSVALSADGKTAVIGGEADDSNRGAAWVFNRRTSGFFQDVPKLNFPSDGTTIRRMGTSVSVNANGNFLVVGGLSDDRVAAWVYSKVGGQWSLDAPKIMGAGLKNIGFNPHVSISGDGYLVAVSGDLDNSTTGVATLWKRAIGSWRESGNLPLGTPVANSYFQGAAVVLSLDGTTAISGAPGTNGNNGASWIYKTLQQGAVPQINTPVNNSTGNGPKPLISGTAEPIATVNIYIDGSSIPIQVVANAVGDWSYTPTSNLSDGTHTVAATSTVSGTTSNSSAIVYFSIVSPEPTISSINPGAGPVGTLVTITGNNLNNPDFVNIGGVDAIVVNSSSNSIMAMVMPNAVSGAVSLGSANKTITASSNFTVTPTLVPNTQEGSKLVGNGGFNPKLGWSLAVSADGNTAVVGGYADDGYVGAAWVFNRQNGVWRQQGNKLVGSGFVNTPSQGYSVAISADGNTIAIGGNADAGYGPGKGAVWIFTRFSNQWYQQGRKLVGSGGSGNAQFGTALSLSADGNTLMVGAPNENGGLGAAYVFTRVNDTWSQFGRVLIPDDNAGYPEFGKSIAISSDGKTAVIGGNKDGNTGATWVFKRYSTEFAQDADKLVAKPDATRLQKEGSSVAISADGNTIISGGLSNNNPAAWIFVRKNGLWSQQSGTLYNPNAIVSSSVVSLSADGNAAILAIGIDDASIGSAITFKRVGTNWQQAGNLPLGTGAIGAALQGLSAAVISSDATTALVGGSQDNQSQGAVWVYKYAARTSPPIIIAPAINAILQTAQPVISGTAESNAVINLFIDGSTNPIRVNANPDGTWHYTPVNPLSEGGHTVAATATANGTTSILSDIINFTVDSKPASLLYVSISSNNSDSSKASIGNRITLSFTASEKITPPTVSIGGIKITATNIANNQWTATVDANALTDGLVSFQIGFRDLGNNPSADISATTNQSSVTVDKTAPKILSITRLDASPTNAAQIRFRVLFSEPVKGVILSDFSPFVTGAVTGASLQSISGSGDSYIVTVNRGQGAGTLNLDFNVGLSIVKDLAGNDIRLSYKLGEIYTIVVGAVNVIGTIQPFSICAGAASAAQSFQVNANGLTGELAIDAPTGFEVSLAASAGFGPFVDILPTNGNIPNTTIYVRTARSLSVNANEQLYLSTQNLGRQTISLIATVSSAITTPVISNVGSTSICSPGTVVLNSNAASGNQWYRDGNLIAGANASSFTTSTTGGYSVVVTSGACASNPSNVIAVSVNTTPAIPVISTVKSTTVCEGASVPLSVSNQSGNTWFKDGVVIPGATGSIYQATSTGAYSVQMANGSGCLSGLSAAVNVTVNPFPVLDPIVGESKVCETQTIILSNSNTTGYWSSSNLAAATIEANGKITAVLAGTSTISYTVSTAAGCSKTITKQLTVYEIPKLPEIVGSSEICVGSSSSLSNSVAGGVWKSSNTAVLEINAGGIVIGKTGGTATVTYIYINANGCTSTVSKLITVVEKAFVEKIVGTNAICINASTQLSNATSGGYWSSKNPTIATVNNQGIVAGVTAGTATIEYTIFNSVGCATYVSKDIIVSALPILSPVIGVQEVCVGATTNFNNAVGGGQWSSDNLNIALVNSQGVVRGVGVGTAKIIYSLANTTGCISSETRDIRVNAVPVLPVVTASKTSFCLPDSAVLTSNAGTGNNWYLNGVAIAGANTNSIVAKTSGNYSLVNSQLGCASPETTPITIQANTKPIKPTLNAIQSANTCAGGSVQLITNNPVNNIWFKDGVSIVGERLNSYLASVSGTYKVLNVGFNACFSDTSDPVIVNFSALPIVGALAGNQSVCVGATTNFASTSAGGVWTSSNHQVATVDQNGLITGISNGVATISYMVTNISGCSTTVTRDLTVNAVPVKPIASTNSATSFCLPGAAILNSNAANGNQWYRDGNLITGANSNTYTATQSGAYTVVSSITGCSSAESDVIDISANAAPTIPSLKAAKQATVCEGSTVKLSTSNQTGNIWYKDAVVIPGVSGSSYTATSSGIYTVQVSNATGCVSGLSAGLTVTIKPKSVVEPIEGRAFICVGTSSSLGSATAGGTWTSSNSAIANINSNGTIRGIGAGTVTISYAVTNPIGCVTTVTKDIVVNAAPAVPVISTTTANSFCLPDSAILNSSATLGNQWFLDGNPIAGANASNYIAKISGNYTVVSTQIGCASSPSNAINIEAKAKPAKPTLKALKSAVGCEGGTVPLLTNNAVNNLWFKDAVSITGVRTNNYLASTSGTYKVVYVDFNGCISDSSDPLVVTLNPLPVVAAISGAQTICVGSTTVYSNTTANGYWSSSNSLVAKVDMNGLVTAVSAGTATISYIVSNASGCSIAVTRDVTVNAVPAKAVISTNSNTSFCLPGSAILNSSAAAGNQWYRNGAILVGATGASFTATATGSYTVVSTISGCTSLVSNPLDISANATPSIPTLAASGATNICDGATVTLTTANPTGNEWFKDGVLLNNVTGASYTTTTAGVFTVKAVNNQGCISGVSNPISVLVNSLPVVASITGDQQVCQGKTVVFSSATIGGIWSSSNVNIATVDASGNVTGQSAGIATIQYTVTNASGCSTIISRDITVNALPTITQIVGLSEICVNESTVLSSSFSGNGIFSWTSSNNAIATISFNGTVRGVSAGTAIVFFKVTGDNGCSLTVARNLIVKALPAKPQIITNDPTSFCLPGASLLTSSSTTGNQWYRNGALIVGATASTYQAISTGAYTVDVTQSGCSSSFSDALSISANATPSVPVISTDKNPEICAGDAVTLTTSQSAGNTWFKDGIALTGITGNRYQATQAGVYTVQAANNTGCLSGLSSALTVKVNPVPIISALIGNQQVCVGSSILFSTSTPGGQWSSSDASIATVDAKGNITGVNAGLATINYTVTNSNGCSTTAARDITVNPLPVSNPILGNADICVGSTSSLTNISVTSGSYSWRSSNPAVATIGGNGIVKGISAGTADIVFSLVISNGCSIKVTRAVNVKAKPSKAIIKTSDATSFCAPGFAILNSFSPNGNQWLKDGVPVGTNIDYSASVSGVYRLIVTENGCTSDTSDPVTISANPIPSLPVIQTSQPTNICEGGTVLLTTSNQSGNQWFKDGQIILGETSANYNAREAGVYTVQVTNSVGCVSGLSAGITVAVNALPTISSIIGNQLLCVGATTNYINSTPGGVWSSSNPAVALVNAAGQVTGITAGVSVIDYRVTNASGCSTTVSMNVFVNALPVIAAITGNTVVCVGAQTQLISSIPGNGQKIWTSSNTAIATVNNDGLVMGVSTGTATISYTVTNLSGCSSTVSQIVTVNALPTKPVLTAATATSFCLPGSVQLTSNLSSGNQWYKDGLIILGATGNSYSASSSGSYSVIATNLNGCISQESNPIAVSANATPSVPIITANSSNSFCVGGSVVLSTASQSGNLWYKDAVLIPGVNTGTYTVTQSGVYTVQSLNAAGCVSGTSAGLTVTVNPLPVVASITGTQTVCVGSSTNFANTTNAGIWTSSNSNIATINASGQITGLTAGTVTISYTVTNAAGCATTVTRDLTVLGLPSKPSISTNSSTSFCKPASAILVSNAGLGNQWYIDGSAITGANADRYTATQSGVYTVTSLSASGCISAQSDGINIVANELPIVPPLVGDQQVCEGGFVKFSSAVTGGGWISSNVNIATVGGSGLVHGIAAGTATIRYRLLNASGCETIVTRDITVNALPILTAITSVQQVCVGNTTQLSSSNNTNTTAIWSSANTSIASVDANGLVTAISPGSAVINYTATNLSGCKNTVTASITVNALPSKPLLTASSSTSFCSPGAVVLVSNATSGNQWFKDGIAIAGANSNNYSATVTGTYSVIVTNASGCVSEESDGVDVTSNVTPSIPNLKAIKSTNLCEGGSVKLSTSNQTGNIWYKDGVVIPGVTGSSYTASTSGIYTVQVANTAGCVSGTSAGLTVTVNALPVLSAITGTQTVCVGSTTDFANATSGGVWSSANANIATVNAVGQITGVSAGTTNINYILANASGCQTVVSRSITVNPLPVKPTISTNSATSFCIGGTATLISDASSGNQWYLEGSVIQGATNEKYVASQSGNYTLTTVSASGCISLPSNGLLITVNALPVVSPLVGDQQVCEGGFVKFSSATTGGGWISSNTNIATVSGSGLVRGIASGTATISYRVFNATGCVTTVTRDITVNALPILSAITGSQQICVGAATQLNSTVASGSAIWSSNIPSIASVDQNGLVNGIATGSAIITYTATNNSGCTTAVNTSITVNSLPNKSLITANGSTSFCLPGSVVLNSSISSGNQWYKDGVAIVGATGNSYTATVSGSYTVIAINASGCVGAESDAIDVSASATPSVPSLKAVKNTSFCEGGSVRLSTSNQTGNIWYKDGVVIAGVTGSSYTATASGVYTVQVANTAGCVSGTSAGLTVTVNAVPVVSAITGTQVVCEGSAVNFASATSGAVWSSSNASIATVSGSGQVTGVSAGTATISYTLTNASGCITTVTRDISVTALPVKPTVSTNSATSFCLPGSAVLTSSAATGNQWYLDGVAIAGATGNSYTASVAGAYTVIVNQSGCASAQSNALDIVTNTAPAIPNVTAARNANVCEGRTVKLTTDHASGNSWYKDGVLIAGFTGSGYVASASGVYTVQHTNISGCTSGLSAGVTVTINALPSVAAISGTQLVCVGESTQFSNTAAGGNWMSTNTGIATVDGTGRVIGVASGTASITYTVTNASGCTVTVTRAVTVNAVPSKPVLTAVSATAFCLPGSVTINSSASSGNQWYKDGVAIVGATGNSYTATVSGSYTVIASNASGCVSVESDAIDVSASATPTLPSLKAVKNTSFCEGGSVKLSTSNQTGNIWYKDGVVIPGVTGSSYTATTSGNYTVQVANTAGCVSGTSAGLTVTVNALPVVSAITGTQVVCEGSAVNFASATGGGVWSSSNGSIATVSHSGQITGVGAGTATISYAVTNASGCITTVTRDISVTALPVKPTISTNSATSFCLPGSAVLTSSAATGNQWYLNGNAITGATANVYTATQTGTYTVNTTTSGCASAQSDGLDITANASPAQPTLKAAKNPIVCEGTTVKISTNYGTGNTWYKDGIVLPGVTESFYTSSVSGNYTVQHTDLNGCTSILSPVVSVLVNAVPVIPAILGSQEICAGNNTQLTNSLQGGIWSSTNTGIATVNTAGLVTGLVAGNVNILYTVTNASGCVSTVVKSIGINALPSVAPIQGTGIICVGDSAQFTNATALGQWSISNNTVATITNTGILKAIAAGTVIINYTITNGNGCNTTVSKTITVSQTPTAPVISAAGSLEFCVGASVTLRTNANNSIIWYRDGLLIDSAINKQSILAILPGSYSSRNYNTYCVSPASQPLVVTNKPITQLADITGPDQLCLNTNVALSNSLSGGVWTSSNTNIATVNAAGLVTAKAVGTVQISYTASSQGACVATVVKTLTINGLPNAPLTTAKSALTFCEGGSVALVSSSNSNTVWYRDGVFIDTAFQTQTLVTGQSGVYTALVFDSNFCLSPLSTPVTVTVNSLPAQPVISSNGTTSFCLPGSVVLTSSQSTGNRWFLNGAAIQGATAATFTAAVSGSYSVVSTQLGCASPESDLVEIQANATASVPSLKTAKSATVCEGGSVKLLTGSSSGNEWFKNGVLISGVTGNAYTTTESGIYTVRTNNAAGCVSGTSAAITVNILPKINIAPITGSDNICVNTNTLFSSGTVGGTWTSNDTLTAIVNNIGQVTALRPGLATITYTIVNAGGCVSTATKDILVKNIPLVPKITINGATSFCAPGSVVLNSSLLTANQWYLNGVAIPGAIGATYTATASGSYAVGNAADGCNSLLSDAVDIQANPIPAIPVLRAVKSTTACEGGSVQLVTASSGTNFWYRNGILIDGVNGNSFNATSSGSYTVQTTSLAACASGTSAAVIVTIQALPVVTAITGNQQLCLNGNTVLSNTTTGGVWVTDNAAVANVNSSGLVTGSALGTASIQYKVTGSNGCVASVSRTVTVNPLPVVAAITGANAICVNTRTSFANATLSGVWTSNNSSIATVNASTGEITGIAAGTATIRYTVSNSSGCSTVVSKDIQVNALPLVTASASAPSVSKGRDVQLTATGTGNFAWSPIQNISNVNAASTTARVTEKTTFTVTLTNALGCVNTASVTVDAIEDLYVEPTIVFTPNGDGINDKFVIKNLDQYPNNRLQIFDRNGKVLFEQNDYANNWDGRVNGQLLTKDTYLFILTIKGQIVKKGTLTLVR